MGNSCNHEREEEIEEDTICCTRGEEDIYQNIFSVSSQRFLHILNSKVIHDQQCQTDTGFNLRSVVPDRRLHWIELFGTEIDLSDTNQQRGRCRLDRNLRSGIPSRHPFCFFFPAAKKKIKTGTPDRRLTRRKHHT